MLPVVGVLDAAAALRLLHSSPHGRRNLVGVKDDKAFRITGGTADGLDQTGLTAEEALLVGVQNGHQTDFRQVQALSQQVDAHQHIELTQTQVPDDLHALDGLHVRVHVPHPDAGIFEIVGQVLRHLLGQRGDQNALIAGGPFPDLVHQVVDLSLNGPDLHSGVQQAGGADHLLHHVVRAAPLIGPGGGGHEHRLADPLLKLLEFQGAVIIGAGQAEAVLHKAVLAGVVAVVHGPHLGQRHMALVHEQQKVVREEVQQGHRRRAGGPVGDDAGVVLNAGAIAQLRHHLHVIFGPLADALRLHQLIVFRKIPDLFLQLLPDLPEGFIHLILGGDIMAGGIDGHVVQNPVHAAGQRVKIADPVDLISEKFHTDGVVLIIGGVNLHRVAPDPEHVALKGDVVALVADLHQTAQQLVPVPLCPHAEGHHQFRKIVRLAQTVDAGHGGHHDHVPPLQQSAGGGEAQAVDLIVGGGVLGDIGIRMGDIGLGLIVIVIADKVFHRVVGEKLLELGAQLGRQGLVVGQNQGGPLGLLDHLRHGKGLAGAGDAQQDLLLQPVLNALRQSGDGLGLVAGRLVFRNDFKFRHILLLCGLTAIRCPSWIQRSRPRR